MLAAGIRPETAAPDAPLCRSEHSCWQLESVQRLLHLMHRCADQSTHAGRAGICPETAAPDAPQCRSEHSCWQLESVQNQAFASACKILSLWDLTTMPCFLSCTSSMALSWEMLMPASMSFCIQQNKAGCSAIIIRTKSAALWQN
jgi:hypothetical protein